MTRVWTILFAFILITARPSAASAQAGPKPPSADAVIQSACKEAASSHRKVFIIFHASWCGWCHQMDSIMSNPACKKLFTDQYVVEHLVIMEHGDKESLINPGAQELYAKYAGEKGQGIPFWLIFNPDGKVIADSRNKPDGAAPGSTGNNVGCPSEPDEVTYFIKVLHATSTLSADQLDLIKKNFTIRKA